MAPGILEYFSKNIRKKKKIKIMHYMNYATESAKITKLLKSYSFW